MCECVCRYVSVFRCLFLCVLCERVSVRVSDAGIERLSEAGFVHWRKGHEQRVQESITLQVGNKQKIKNKKNSIGGNTLTHSIQCHSVQYKFVFVMKWRSATPATHGFVMKWHSATPATHALILETPAPHALQHLQHMP